MQILILLIMLASTFGVASGIEMEMPEPEWHGVTINGNPGVVAPRHAAPEFARDADGFWLPSEEWLTEAENAIVSEAGLISDEDRRPVIDGYRQYAGFISGDERKIAINSFCHEVSGNWKHSRVFVLDGGNCFWYAIYNVDTAKIESLQVNGQA